MPVRAKAFPFTNKNCPVNSNNLVITNNAFSESKFRASAGSVSTLANNSAQSNSPVLASDVCLESNFYAIADIFASQTSANLFKHNCARRRGNGFNKQCLNTYALVSPSSTTSYAACPYYDISYHDKDSPNLEDAYH